MLDNADIAWRVVHRARFALAALLAFGACRDTPTGPSELLGGVLLDERAATTSEGCALPWGCTIASTPTSEVIAAVAEATTIPFITGVATTGAPEQTAVVVAPDGGFPTDGSKYLVVSSGDARNPRWDGAWTWEPDWRDSAYGCACYPGTGDEATLTLTLALPPAAVAVEIDYRFFSADGAGLYHGPPWYEWSWIRLQTMTGTVLRETWGTGMVFTCPQFWPWRCIPDFWFPGGIQRLVADVRSVAGQAVQIQAYTADRGRHVQQQGILQSGVAIDGLRIVLGNLPPVANAGGPYVSDEGAVFQVDGSQSSDPEGGALTYAWDLDADGAFDERHERKRVTYIFGQRLLPDCPQSHRSRRSKRHRRHHGHRPQRRADGISHRAESRSPRARQRERLGHRRLHGSRRGHPHGHNRLRQRCACGQPDECRLTVRAQLHVHDQRVRPANRPRDGHRRRRWLRQCRA